MDILSNILIVLSIVSAIVSIATYYIGFSDSLKVTYVSLGILVLSIFIPTYYQTIESAINLKAFFSDYQCAGQSCTLQYLNCTNTNDARKCLDELRIRSNCKFSPSAFPHCITEGAMAIINQIIKNIAGILPTNGIFTIRSGNILGILGSGVIVIGIGIAFSLSLLLIFLKWIFKLLTDFKNADLVSEFRMSMLLPLQLIVTPLTSVILILGFGILSDTLQIKLAGSGYVDFARLILTNDINGVTLPFAVILILILQIVMYLKVGMWTAKIIQYLIFSPVGAVLTAINGNDANTSHGGIVTYSLAIMLASMTSAVMNIVLVGLQDTLLATIIGVGLALCAISSDTIVKEYVSASQAPSVQGTANTIMRVSRIFTKK